MTSCSYSTRKPRTRFEDDGPTGAALATMVIFTFINLWHDFLGPLIYLNDSSLFTLVLGVSFFKGQYTAQWNWLMASSTALIVPPLLIFFFAQRFFIEGIQLGGVKG